jgi:hypothetical protein
MEKQEYFYSFKKELTVSKRMWPNELKHIKMFSSVEK